MKDFVPFYSEYANTIIRWIIQSLFNCLHQAPKGKDFLTSVTFLPQYFITQRIITAPPSYQCRTEFTFIPFLIPLLDRVPRSHSSPTQISPRANSKNSLWGWVGGVQCLISNQWSLRSILMLKDSIGQANYDYFHVIRWAGAFQLLQQF